MCASIISDLGIKSFPFHRTAVEDQPRDSWKGSGPSAYDHVVGLLSGPDVSQGKLTELSSWRFGDAILTRAVCAAPEIGRWLHRSHLFPEHDSVVLVRSGSGRRMSSVLAISPDSAIDLLSLRIGSSRASNCEVLTLFLPKSSGDVKAGEFTQSRTLDTRAGSGALLESFMRELARQLPSIPDEQRSGLAVAARMLVETCFASPGTRTESPDTPLVLGLADRARLMVRQNMAMPDFGPEQLARLLAVSRSKLYRLLDNAGGVAHFINRERLVQAHRRLVSCGDTLSIHAIGNEVGFLDHSTFSRAFRRAFGYSPSEAREMALAPLTNQSPNHIQRPRAGNGKRSWDDTDNTRDRRILAALDLTG